MALIVMTAVCNLILSGFAQASTTANPSADAAGGAKSLTAPKPGSTCEVTRSGRVADCQKPVAKGDLPAGARNNAIVSRAVQDLASLVDARTWTTAGGNTFPGAEVPFATATITRDDSTDTTLYELVLPWSDLSSVQPSAGTVFSISALDNDTDNGIREGFLQWGGGIGSDKNVAEFNMAQLMP